MIKTLAILPALLILPACSLFDNSDPREGVEAQDVCIKRVTASLGPQQRTQFAALDGAYVPSFTYDVTKMGLDGVKTLMVEGSDETAGSRLMAQTNIETTAVALFKAEPVDEKGAFFLGRDPALYRVRGEAVRVNQLIASGCERQQANMRLIGLDWAKSATGTAENKHSDAANAATDNENNS